MIIDNWIIAMFAVEVIKPRLITSVYMSGSTKLQVTRHKEVLLKVWSDPRDPDVTLLFTCSLSSDLICREPDPIKQTIGSCNDAGDGKAF